VAAASAAAVGKMTAETVFRFGAAVAVRTVREKLHAAAEAQTVQ